MCAGCERQWEKNVRQAELPQPIVTTMHTNIRTHGHVCIYHTFFPPFPPQFDIQDRYFAGALDRFAQFFKSPLMKKDCIRREAEAVDGGLCVCARARVCVCVCPCVSLCVSLCVGMCVCCVCGAFACDAFLFRVRD